MSEHEPMPTAPQKPPRRSYLRKILWLGGGTAAILIVLVVGICFWANSSWCENLIREQLVARLETMTGGRVEIASFHWHPFDLEAEANGLVIHGREAPGETPYAQVGQLHVRISVLGLWSPRILLRNLEIVHPSFHLIVYPDGSTNQPQPRNPAKSGKSALDTFFDLKADHVAVEEGILDYENRASSFDFQNRFTRLDFAANDVSLRLSYVAPKNQDPESYRIEAGARDLTIVRGQAAHPSAETAEGFMQATLDLTRNAVYLRSLRLTSRSKRNGNRTLDVSGALKDFARPQWEGKAKGELDMSLMEPITGYPDTPEGIARVDLDGRGTEWAVSSRRHCSHGRRRVRRNRSQCQGRRAGCACPRRPGAVDYHVHRRAPASGRTT